MQIAYEYNTNSLVPMGELRFARAKGALRSARARQSTRFVHSKRST